MGFVNPVIRPIAKSKARATLGSEFSPSPHSADPVGTHGADPDRILLVGNATLNGWGVLSHEDGVPGHLVRELSARTGTAAEAVVVGEPSAVCADLPGLLSEVDFDSFDAVVVVIGASDAYELLPAKKWRESLETLVAFLLTRVSVQTEVLLMGTEPLSTVPFLHVAAGGPVDQLTAQFNEITLAVTARPPFAGRVHYVAPPRLSINGPTTRDVYDPSEMRRVSEGYHEWAKAMASTLKLLRAKNVAWSGRR